MKTIDIAGVLAKETWEANKVIPVVQGSHRHRVVVQCSPSGRQSALFTNGEHGITSYVELTRPDGSWTSHGTCIVPVLPDGRLIMIVEQRPAQERLGQSAHFTMDDHDIDLSRFGPYSSLEFPGGAVDKEDRSFQAGFLRELAEETGAVPSGTVYAIKNQIYPFGPDISHAMHYAVIYLDGMKFSDSVEADGGLHVFALKPEDVIRNIRSGNIQSGHTVLTSYFFYLEVEKMRHRRQIDTDFATIDVVHLKKEV